MVLSGAFGIIVWVWQVINEIDAWVLWAIGAALYTPSIILMVSVKVFGKQAYRSCLRKKGRDR